MMGGGWYVKGGQAWFVSHRRRVEGKVEGDGGELGDGWP